MALYHSRMMLRASGAYFALFRMRWFTSRSSRAAWPACCAYIAWVSAHNSKQNVSPAISISRFRYSRPTPAACNSTLLNPVSTTERFRNCSSGWIGCMQLLSVDGYLCRALRRLRPHESGKARQALHQQKGPLVGHHLRHEIGPVLADESLEQFAVDVLEQGVEVLIGLHENDLAGRGRRSRALLVAGVHQVHPRVGLLRFHLRGELAERLQHGLGFVVVVGLYVPLRN